MQLNTALRYIALAGIFLLPFIVFIVAEGMFFPFIAGKNFAFRILVEITVGAWLILAIRDARFRLKRSALVWALTAFVVVIFIADIFGANFMRSFWSNFERMEGFVTLLHLFGYVLAAGAMLNTEKLWTRLLQTTVGASVIMGIYGLFQLAGVLTINQGGVRVDGTFGNATYLAVYMLFHIFLTLLLVVRHKGAKAWYWLYGAALVLQAVMLYFTATRGALLGLLGGLLLTALLIALFEKTRPRLRKVSIGTIIVVLLLVGVFFGIKNAQFVQDNAVLSRFANISLEDKTTRSRFIIWGMAFEGFKEHPILGTGQENFNLIFNKHYDSRLYDQEQWFDRAHNVVFDWLTAGGVLGLLAYLSIFIATLYLLWRKDSLFATVERSILTGLLAGYFFHNLFVFDNVTSYLFFGTVLALIYAGYGRRGASEYEPQRQTGLHTAFVVLVVLLTVGAVYFFNVPGIRANKTLIQAIRPQEEGLEKNLELFERVFALDTYANPEARERLGLMAQQLPGTGAPEEIQREFIVRARGALETQVGETPDDARYWFFLGTFLSRTGDLENGLTALERAHELSSGKQQILFEIALNYASQGQNEAALTVFKQAFELEPAYELAKQFYAATALRGGDRELGNQLVDELLAGAYNEEGKPTFVPAGELINALIEVGKVEKVEQLWELRAAARPDDPQARVSHAATLIELGRTEEAVEVLKQAGADIPSFSQRAGELIDQIRAGRI